MTLDMQSARSGGGGAPSWLRRMESNHRRLVYETSVNTNSLRHKRPGDLYTASRRDTVRLRTQAPDGSPHPIGEPGYLTNSSSPLLAKMRLFYTDSHLLS